MGWLDAVLLYALQWLYFALNLYTKALALAQAYISDVCVHARACVSCLVSLVLSPYISTSIFVPIPLLVFATVILT